VICDSMRNLCVSHYYLVTSYKQVCNSVNCEIKERSYFYKAKATKKTKVELPFLPNGV